MAVIPGPGGASVAGSQQLATLLVSCQLLVSAILSCMALPSNPKHQLEHVWYCQQLLWSLFTM